MHGHVGISRTHRACGDMAGHAPAQVPVEFAVDERVEIAAIAEMVEAHHGGGNPVPGRLLPGE